jgi:hypothetical protein
MLFQKLFAGDGGSAVRSLLRALTVLLTAFVLSLSPEQIGAIQLVVEALIAVLVRLVPNPPAPPADPAV